MRREMDEPCQITASSDDEVQILTQGIPEEQSSITQSINVKHRSSKASVHDSKKIKTVTLVDLNSTGHWTEIYSDGKETDANQNALTEAEHDAKTRAI